MVRGAVAVGHGGRDPTPDPEGQGVGPIPGLSVGLWMSDKQDAFVKGIAAEFPDVPHRYCDNHFLRDLAQPVLDADSHAKVQMRKKVRGLRTIEQVVLRRPKAQTQEDLTPEARRPPGRRPRRGTGLLPWSMPRGVWCWTTVRPCVGSSMTIKEGRWILPGCGWPRHCMRFRNRFTGTWR